MDCMINQLLAGSSRQTNVNPQVGTQHLRSIYFHLFNGWQADHSNNYTEHINSAPPNVVQQDQPYSSCNQSIMQILNHGNHIADHREAKQQISMTDLHFAMRINIYPTLLLAWGAVVFIEVRLTCVSPITWSLSPTPLSSSKPVTTPSKRWMSVSTPEPWSHGLYSSDSCSWQYQNISSCGV